MILKGSQRGGPRALALHLMNMKDNDHVTIAEIRGFCSEDLFSAMAETHAVANGTRCRQPVFSLSLNPPKDKELASEILVAAIDRAEAALGLGGQPRAIVIHEKHGRKHAHVVWSRINADTMTAVNLPFFKFRLKELSKQLYLEHGWDLPQGHRANGGKNPLNFTLDEWQQAKRHDLDPREIKQAFQDAWRRSDNLTTLRHALEEQGYFLAKGDSRTVVALDIHGKVYSLARWCQTRSKHIAEKLGPGTNLPSVDEARKAIRNGVAKNVIARRAEQAQRHEIERKPLKDAAHTMRAIHRKERESMAKRQTERWRKEAVARAGKFRRGLGIVMDALTGRLFALRKENELEAHSAWLRDRAQREQLFSLQFKEREALQKQIDRVSERHRLERLRTARRIMAFVQTRPRKAEADYGYDL